MCRQKIICYAACGHEEYEGEPIHCSDFEKFLNSLSWNFKLRNHKGLRHCVKIVYERVANPSPCNGCNAHAFRQQRALAPGPQKKGNDQYSAADAGLVANKSQVQRPRSGDNDQQLQTTADAPDPFINCSYKRSARELQLCKETDREVWRPYLRQKSREEQVVSPLQESPLGRRGAIPRTSSTENLRRIRRDSQPDSPSYLTIPSRPVERDSAPKSALNRRGAIRRTSTAESHRRSVRNSQSISPSYLTKPPCPDLPSDRPLKSPDQWCATRPPSDKQRRRYFEAIGTGGGVFRPQQGVEPVLDTPLKNEPDNRRSGILLAPDRRSTGSKRVSWADEMYLESPNPRQESAKQPLTPPMSSSRAPLLPEPLRVEKTSPVPDRQVLSRRRSRFLEDIGYEDLGY